MAGAKKILIRLPPAASLADLRLTVSLDELTPYLAQTEYNVARCNHSAKMKISSTNLRSFAGLLLMFGLVSSAIVAEQQPHQMLTLPLKQQVVTFLRQSVEWYHNSLDQPGPFTQPEDIPFVANTQALSIQILRLSFDYAKAVAALQPNTFTSPDQDSGAAVTARPESDVQRLATIEAQCEAKAQVARGDIASIQKKIDTRRGPAQTSAKAALADFETRLNLLQSQCEAYRGLLDFAHTTGGSAPQNQGLNSVIDEISRTVPELANPGATASSSPAGSSRAISNATGSSVSDLISDVVAFHRKLDVLDRASRSTDGLAQSSETLKALLAQYLTSALQESNLTSNVFQRGSLEALRQQKTRLNALSAQITGLSPALIALDKQQIFLASTNPTLPGGGL